MSEMIDFKRDFVDRSIKVLNKYFENEEYEVTLLLNCLLALVTLPIENKKDIENEDVNEFKKKCVNKLKELKNDMFYIKMDYKTIFRNIRNSIAHLNIKEKSNNGKIESITLWNVNKKEKINFKVNISVENLKIFAEYVAKEYINSFFNN